MSDGAQQLQPLPASAGTCPRCETALSVRRLRLAGWRIALDGSCPACGHRYLQDLPSGHGLVYPATLDIDTGDMHERSGAAWFSGFLRSTWEEPDLDPVRLEIDTRHRARDAILLNCLDPIFGHSLLKLLNVQRALAGDRDVIALVPSSLVHLVPAEVAEVWVVHEPHGRLFDWLVDLERQLEVELARVERCVLMPAAPHPHPSTYDLESLVASFPPERLGSPQIALSLRDDRLWGASAEAQRSNVSKLRTALLEEWPDAVVVALGVGGAAELGEGVVDLRELRPNAESERRWVSLLRATDLAIGIHGSNLLLPSGLARLTVELAPRGRWGNVLQATLPDLDPVLAMARQRTVYGSDHLADLSATRICEVAITSMRELPRIAALMTGPLAGAGVGSTPRVPASAPLPPESPAPAPRRQPLHVIGLGLASGLDRRRSAQRERALLRRAEATELPAVMSDREGARFELVTREEVELFLRHGGHFERTEIELVRRTLGTGMTAFDVGANVGAFTVAMARATAPGGSVHAFEPSPATAGRLATTLELNELENVTVCQMGVSDTVGEADLFGYGEGKESWATLSPREIELAAETVSASDRTPIQTTTLDDYCEENAIERVDTLKVDVEGAERLVLAGATRLLASHAIDLMLLELSDSTLEAFGDRGHEVVDLIESAGLRTLSIGEEGLRPYRAAGTVEGLVTLVACTPAGLERLRAVSAL